MALTKHTKKTDKELITVLEFAKRRQVNFGSRKFIYDCIKNGSIIPSDFICRGEEKSPLIDWNVYKDFPITKKEREDALSKHLSATYNK